MGAMKQIPQPINTDVGGLTRLRSGISQLWRGLFADGQA
jgi:hypothetical protein